MISEQYKVKYKYTKFLRTWSSLFKDLSKTKYMYNLFNFIENEYNDPNVKIYPNVDKIFNALHLCSQYNCKVVILGDAPSTDGTSNGLAFGSELDFNDIYGHANSTSLKLLDGVERSKKDKKLILDFDYTLEQWAKQGVLLLNTALTSKKDDLLYYQKHWEGFIIHILSSLSNKHQNIHYLLWGKEAKKFKKYIKTENNYIFSCISPREAAKDYKKWYNMQFELVNMNLVHNNRKEIIW